MKVFVRGYRPLTDEEVSDAPLGSRDETAVVYSAEPDWKLTSRDEADFECKMLNEMNVHIGQHVCDFAVENLPDGQFTLVCRTHPDFLSLAPTLSSTNSDDFD